jgi:hypothetical protein
MQSRQIALSRAAAAASSATKRKIAKTLAVAFDLNQGHSILFFQEGRRFSSGGNDRRISHHDSGGAGQTPAR